MILMSLETSTINNLHLDYFQIFDLSVFYIFFINRKKISHIYISVPESLSQEYFPIILSMCNNS